MHFLPKALVIVGFGAIAAYLVVNGHPEVAAVFGCGSVIAWLFG